MTDKGALIAATILGLSIFASVFLLGGYLEELGAQIKDKRRYTFQFNERGSCAFDTHLGKLSCLTNQGKPDGVIVTITDHINGKLSFKPVSIGPFPQNRPDPESMKLYDEMFKAQSENFADELRNAKKAF